MQRDFAGTVTAAVDASAGQDDGVVVVLDAAALTGVSGGDPVRSGWAVAQWAVAAAEALDVVAVEVAGSRWDRGTPGWHVGASDAPPATATVAVTLAG